MNQPQFSLEIIAYLRSIPKGNNLSFEEASELISTHTELHSWRKDEAIQWMKEAKAGEKFRTFTDLMESDQADVFMHREI